MESPERPGWHKCWEENVYARGRQLNRYPHHAVVGFILSNYGQVTDRSAIRIAELGFGAGNNLWFAAREGFSTAGLEGSPTAVAYARNRFRREGLVGDLRIGDFSLLPWRDESFDVVIDRGALTCTIKSVIRRALQESARVLKPGGRLFSIIYSHEHPGRAFGRDRGDNDYDQFRGGYFAGLGTAHFVPPEEIEELYGSCLTIRSVVHCREEQTLGGKETVNAYWKIECTKSP